MTDLVVVSLEAWDGVWRRNQHLIHQLLAADPHLRVLFVEPAADPTHAATRRVRPRPGVGLRSEPDHPDLALVQLTKWLPRRVDPRADERIAAGIARAAAVAGFRDPLLWINDPDGAATMRRTGWRSVYDITDDWLLADRPTHELAHWQSAESTLLRECAEVVVCSPTLAASKSQHRRVELISNGIEPATYLRPTQRPTDLPPRPVALYLGTAHEDRIDVDLCVRTARHLAPDADLVLVGPNALSPGSTARLEEAGVRLLGARAHDQVAAYLQHAEVLVVPHVATAFTDSLDPIKLYEYAAVGRPVVSTAVAGFRDATDERIRIAPTANFPAAVAHAISESWPFPDHSDPSVPTWAERAAQWRVVLDRVAASR